MKMILKSLHLRYSPEKDLCLFQLFKSFPISLFRKFQQCSELSTFLETIHLKIEESSKTAREESLKLMRLTIDVKRCLYDCLTKVELLIDGKKIPQKPTNLGGLQIPTQNKFAAMFGK